MHHTPFVIFHVADPQASARWFAQLLDQPATETSPTFAMFALGSGAMLGLWQRDAVQPLVDATPGASELALAVQGRKTVDDQYERLLTLGCAVLQPPTAMDFGYTFTVKDLDGHRVRFFAPEGA